MALNDVDVDDVDDKGRAVARAAWVSDVHAHERREKYACTREEVEAKRASRRSAHAGAVRRAMYAQFDDDVDDCDDAGAGSDDDDEEERAGERADAGERTTTTTTTTARGGAVAFDLDMALFWARRRAAAARKREAATSDAGQRIARGARRRDDDSNDDDTLAHYEHAREVEKLKQRLVEERRARQSLTDELERKVAEIERLRSQVAKLKLDNEKKEQQEKLYRYPGQRERMRLQRIRETQNGSDTTEREYEKDLPSYATLQREMTKAQKQTAWFVRTR